MDADATLTALTLLGIALAGIGALTILPRLAGDVGALATLAVLAVATLVGVAIGRRDGGETPYW